MRLLSLALAVHCAASWGPDARVFANHMVIASSDVWSGGSTPAVIWGAGVPGESIRLSGFPAGATVMPANPWTVASDGNWSISLSTPASLTAFNLSFVGKSNFVTIVDVLAGHTMLCAGQSNMGFNVGCSYTADEAQATSLLYPEIRFMNQGADGVWTSAANPKSNVSLLAFSATCYYTALHLKESIPAFKNVPIGLVRSAVGGQAIERFMSIPALEAVGVPSINATGTSCGQVSHTLYDSLIFPLAPFVFKAMIWCALRRLCVLARSAGKSSFLKRAAVRDARSPLSAALSFRALHNADQGEANVECNFVSTPAWESGYYARLLPELVRSWRALFGVNFSTLIVQLAAYGDSDQSSAQRTGDALPALRNAQLSVLSLPSSGIVVAVDLGDDGTTIPIEYSYCNYRGMWHG